MALTSCAIILSLATQSCGGGGGGTTVSSGFPPLPQLSNGTVAVTYPSTASQVLSVWNSAPQVVSSGAFSSLTSPANAHLIFLADSSNVLYGISASIPGSNIPLGFSPSNTATALIFMSPGVFTGDPVAAATAWQSIQSLQSFGAFQQILSSQGSSTLVSVMASTTAQTALLNCMTEWFSNHPAVLSSPRQMIARTQGLNNNLILDHTNVQDQEIGCADDVSNAANVQLSFTNGNFRALEVVEKQYFNNGTTKVVSLPDMAGATTSSLTNLLLGQIGAPSTQIDSVDMSAKGMYKAEYYFRGLGAPAILKPSADVIAAFNKKSFVSLGAETFILYELLPLLDTFGGFATFLDLKGNYVDLVSGLSTSNEFLFSVNDFMSAIKGGNRDDILKAFLNLMEVSVGVIEPIVKKMLITFFESQGMSAAEAVLKAGLGGVMLAAEAIGLNAPQFVASELDSLTWHLDNEWFISNVNQGVNVGVH